MERKLRVINDFGYEVEIIDNHGTFKRKHNFYKGDELDFGVFPDTIYYDIQYDTTIDRKGVVTQTSYDENGQSAIIPIIVRDKYTLYQRLKSKNEGLSLI